jgi:hypothetical protein
MSALERFSRTWVSLLFRENNAPLSFVDKDKFGKYQFSGRARIPMGVHRAWLN